MRILWSGRTEGQESSSQSQTDTNRSAATHGNLSVAPAHAPALRAFLADRLDGMVSRQTALARAVVLARQVC